MNEIVVDIMLDNEEFEVEIMYDDETKDVLHWTAYQNGIEYVFLDFHASEEMEYKIQKYIHGIGDE